MAGQPVLINGRWQDSAGSRTFQPVNPATKQPLGAEYPVSPWSEVDAVLRAADDAFAQIRGVAGDRFAGFLADFADAIERRAGEIVELAHLETALPVEPRLRSVELPRTVSQLRQAAAAAREGSWALPTLDTQANIRSQFESIGPVAVFGPNNFPLAFNSMAGGDFAAAIAAGNPVIAKGHSSHPGTTQKLAEAAHEAAQAAGMPAGFVQLIYRTSHEDGARLVSDPRLGATGYTGSRQAGLFLKQAADRVGKPIYLELSSVNPVFMLPGALRERGDQLAEEFSASCLMGAGQFCTNPGLVVLKSGEHTTRFVESVAAKFASAAVGTLLSEGVEQHLRAGIVALQRAGAQVVMGNQPVDAGRCCFANTLLQVTGAQFLADPQGLQAEAFGNAALVVIADSEDELQSIAAALEGNLTGCFYTDTQGEDDALYRRLEPIVRHRVGRLLNDKMPTGVAVSPAMNHGGPFPATGHPGFTAVGIPASLRRFAMLHCYDSVRPYRLPAALQDANPTGKLWRLVDGTWTQGDA